MKFQCKKATICK